MGKVSICMYIRPDIQQIWWSSRDRKEFREIQERTMPMLQWSLGISSFLLVCVKVDQARRRSARKKKRQEAEAENEKNILIEIGEVAPVSASEMYPMEGFVFFSPYHLWLILVTILLYTIAMFIVTPYLGPPWARRDNQEE